MEISFTKLNTNAHTVLSLLFGGIRSDIIKKLNSEYYFNTYFTIFTTFNALIPNETDMARITNTLFLHHGQMDQRKLH